MRIADIDFTGFTGRKASLQRIQRYHVYSPMFYRADVFFHSIKVFHLVQAALPFAQKIFGNTFQAERALILSLVHDDAEIITGDVQAGHKGKMSSDAIHALEHDELDAIELLSVRFPKEIHGYNYRSLLLEIHHLETVESQFVKYLDHFDVLGEACHELYAGNQRFFTRLNDPSLGEIPLPHEVAEQRFHNQHTKYPLLSSIPAEQAPFLIDYAVYEPKRIVDQGIPHTRQSLTKPTGDPMYDWWRSVLTACLSPQEMEHLYIPKESISSKIA